MAVYIIAEAGSCHAYSLEERYFPSQFVRLAAAAGADAVKFQFWSSPSRMQERRNVKDPRAYLRGSVKAHDLDMLRIWANKFGIDLMCTVYLPEDIKLISTVVDKFKISSFEATDLNFVRQHAGYGKDIIISTGMSTSHHLWHGAIEENVYFLHCVSAYPTPQEQANIGAMQYGYTGYSDHTRNVNTGAIAVGAGAKMLEVHFRDHMTPPTCPDYKVSLTPEELKEYIDRAREADVMMGSGKKEPQVCEKDNMKYRVMGDPTSV